MTKAHNKQEQGEPAMNSNACADDVFEHGTSMGLFAMSKDEAEQYCKAETKRTGYKHDWHYVAGRVHVKALIPIQPKQEQFLGFDVVLDETMPPNTFKLEQPKQEKRSDSEQLGEPVAYLHDDGSWTAAKTDAGRKLNDEVLFIGAPKIGVYTTPPQQRKPLTEYERSSLVNKHTRWNDVAEGWRIDAFGLIDDLEAAHGIKGEE